MTMTLNRNDMLGALPVDGAGLRTALSKFATGVTIVTAQGPTGPVGITVNSFASVSLDPPLVLWSLAKTCNRIDVFESAEFFAIHVLNSDQKNTCLNFTRKHDAFEDLDIYNNENDVPIFDNCLARFECRRNQVLEGGDHKIFLSEVLRVGARDADPMIFFDKAFGQFETQGV